MLDIEDIEHWISRYENEATKLSDCVVLSSLYCIRDNLKSKSSFSDFDFNGSTFEMMPETRNSTEMDTINRLPKREISEELEQKENAVNNVNHKTSSAEKPVKLTRDMAMEWASHMENVDGTTGAHWTIDKTNQVMAQKGLHYDPTKFFLALNATYSDFSKCFRKHGINSIDAYVDFAVAFWLDDKDAVEDKLAAYYTYVVKH